MPQAHANGLTLEYETFGKAGDPAVLLIMGLGVQLTGWPEPLCRSLADAGYYVIRYDNRDVGLSSKVDGGGKPDLRRAGLRAFFGLQVRSPYRLEDMALDAVGLLDALNISRAHVVGLSMGGMIGQLLAINHAERLLSFTAIMTNSGNPRLPQASLKLRLRLVRGPKRRDPEGLVLHSMETWRLIGSPAFPTPEPELRAMVEGDHRRSLYPRGLARQTLAILAANSRVPLLKRIQLPTLVIHGEADPLVPVAAAHELGKHIPRARLEIIPGMGHDLPAALLSRIAQLILGHLRAAPAATSA